MSRKWNNVLRKIEERRKLIRKRELYPYDTFLEKTYRALSLLIAIEESKTNREIKLEARKNFIINCITALEVFLKDMVKGLIDLEAISQKGIDEFLKEKITLKEAWEIFSESEVSLGEIISITCSFQNLTQINSIFSKLLDQDFLEEISHFKVKREDEDIEFTLKENYPDWEIRIVEIFELRLVAISAYRIMYSFFLARIFNIE